MLLIFKLSMMFNFNAVCSCQRLLRENNTRNNWITTEIL